MRHLVVVTGASSGIGKAFVDLARRRGAETATVSRRPGGGDHVLEIDLSDPASWSTTGEWFERLLGEPRSEVDVVHAAATLDPIGPVSHVDPDAYTRNVLLNSAAPQVLGAMFLAALNRHRQPGRLVQISSGAARTAYEGWSSYGAGKAAVDQWVRTVGAEQRRVDVPVHVVSVAPGVVATAMQEAIRDTPPERFPKVERFHDLDRDGHLADPDEVAVALWDAIRDPAHHNGAVFDLRSR